MPPKRILDLPSRQLVDSHLATNWGGPYGDSGTLVAACPPPAISDLRERFPEFASYTDVQIAYAIDDASCWADTSWTNDCGDCTKAILFLAAHFLFMQAQAALTLPEQVSDGEGGFTFLEGGQVTSIGFETMRVGFSKSQAFQGGTDKVSGDFSASPYGQRYLMLLRANVPAVLVV